MNKAQFEFIIAGLHNHVNKLGIDATEEDKDEAVIEYLQRANDAMDIVEELS